MFTNTTKKMVSKKLKKEKKIINFKKGKKNLITDVDNILVGNSENISFKTGVTVIHSEKSSIAGYHVMGGAPGTRETDLLNPDKLVQKINSIVLSGGSVFGLEAASGVCDELRKIQKGFKVNDLNVPIVPSAIIYDLENGGKKSFKKNFYYNLGVQAFNNISNTFNLGNFGAGIGATTENLKGGLGSASIKVNNFNLGALSVVNSFGSTTINDSKFFWASPFEIDEEFGGLGLPKEKIENNFFFKSKAIKIKRENTTLVVVATDAKLTQAEATRVSIVAHDGIARSIYPSHTQFDGDIVFTISTGKKKLKKPQEDLVTIGNAAAICVSRSIARAIYNATPEKNDLKNCWKEL